MLPIEIFRCIANHLNKQDIIECQCVCSCWYKKWIAYSYHHIHIRGKRQFELFFHQALQSSLMVAPYSTGYQIRKMIIENGHIEPFMLGQLPQLCPYLEVFKFDGVVLSQMARRESFQHYQQRRNREELDKVRHHFALWKHMRELVELNGITVSHALLQQQQQNTTARHLTSLSVQFNNQNDRTNSKPSLISSLHHAPNLQALSIECVYLSFEELESTHDSCPALATLCLSHTVLLPMSLSMSAGEATFMCKRQREIKPAMALRRFRFVDGSFCDDTPGWLNYISRKYIYARCLDIGSCSFFAETLHMNQQLSDTSSDLNSHESQLCQIAKSCTRLETLNLQPFRLEAAFFQILDRNATFLSQLTLGDGLTNSLVYELEGLVQSRQRDHVESLTILGWPLATDIRGSQLLMASLGQCTHITTLHLSLGRYVHRKHPVFTATTTLTDNATVYLDFLLAQCPKLTHLTITDAKLATTGGGGGAVSTSKHYYYTLKSLQLENVMIDSGSDVFHIIATGCTELTDLSLISTISSPVYHTTRNFNIYLPHHRLKTLVLDRIRVSRKCSVRLGACRFKITQDMQTAVWYDLIGYECCPGPSSSSSWLFFTKHDDGGIACGTDKMRASKVKRLQDADVNYSDLDQSVYVSVVCKHIDSLYLTGLYIAQ
ncbi:hypothetical protein [Parasitella parasitica]|uniref:F-box domain-containing protein n=1 Tax=Parasitella parasitica TaxID=35722 RepID=A0A0B7MU33_9FUNG|nr:hypothetical protein [Parasitella parasitica]